MTRRKKIGDVYEIKTSKGLAYFQYTHENEKMGSLIRVLDEFYAKRPLTKDLQNLVNKKHKFQTFCYLNDAIKKAEVVFIENLEIPLLATNFPIFKGTNSMPKRDPLDKIWWLWDGEKSWRVGKLSLEEQMKYPIKKLCDATALIKNIETGKFFSDTLC